MIIPYKENETIIFNPLYGSLGKLEDDVLERFNNDTLTEEEKNEMFERHIFIKDDFDEITKINQGRVHGINNPNRKVFRIWTTSGCNARCYYCFEKGVAVKTMDTVTMIQVAKYVCDRIEKGNEIKLEWFGGEPLLNIKAIETISEIVMDKCKELDAQYISSIITNGSLVDNTTVDLFKRYNIKRAQITLDGYRSIYNESKNYVNKELHNFDNVIDSIRLLSDNGIRVSVRLNYDNKNYESLSELIDYLQDNFGDNKLVKTYVYPLWSAVKDGEFTTEAFADNNYIKLIDKLVNYGQMDPERVIGLRRKVTQCAARNINSVAILPDGSISKCSETFTQVIGNITDGITDTKTYNEWTSGELHEECKTCKYLPVCNDGCMSARYTNMDSCMPTKDIFDDIVRWYVNYLDTHK